MEARGRSAQSRGRGYRGRGRGRGGDRGAPRQTQLRANAAEFVPGQPQQRTQPTREKQKSTAPDIATRTHEDIDSSLYECPICTNEVQRSSKVWSCKTCWTVFHLGCIKKWSENEGSTLAQRAAENGELPPARQWRCPGCNLPKDVLPSAYTCWCEKEVDPRSTAGLPPHSCGQSCGKQRPLPKNCPHPCETLCHAGPCSPCSHIGPTQICFCGKNASTRRCVDTNYDTGWSCGEICGDLLPCGEHACSRPCHEGLCGACEVPINAKCYCGKVTKDIICSDKTDEKRSWRSSSTTAGDTSPDEWIGVFSCKGTCDRLFDCGKHACKQSCHAQSIESTHCPQSPDLIRFCTCGKTPLTDLSLSPRESCKDPIPNCSKECSKHLPCGHTCEKICHSEQCPPCFKKVEISCQCGRTSVKAVCLQGIGEPPQCMRMCRASLNCGRHTCEERCCPGERKAIERQATKRKLRPLGATITALDQNIEAEHVCTRVCGRNLRCGNHTCEELCHRGPCGSCREAIFDEISCHCGKTVLQPPQPCGTNPPPCRFPCERRKQCAHEQVPHNCHGDDESCPNCPFLVQKPCLCGKKMLRNQPCFLSEVRCGEVCGRKLRCGSHYCQKQCHRPGECEDSDRSCGQPCGKPKKACSHPCEERCHAPSACKEEKACQHKLLITCDCQNLKTETKCLASRASEGNTKKSLKCDDECARLERNRKLAFALNIDPATHQDDCVPYSKQTLQTYAEHAKWAQPHEREFRTFAADETSRRLHFKPMKSHHRAFLHSLAEDFGFDSESLDPEPHRHVCVFKTPRFVSAPMKTLDQSLRIANIKLAASSTTTPASRSTQEYFNALLLTNPRFGLTEEELSTALVPALAQHKTLTFDITFNTKDDTVILRPRPTSATTTLSPAVLATALRSLKTPVHTAISKNSLGGSVFLCVIDTQSGAVTRLESSAGGSSTLATTAGLSSSGENGWSQVAAKAAAGVRFAPRVEVVKGKNNFVVLEKAAEKKRREEMQVVDDWEEEMRREERGERREERELGVGKEAEQELEIE